MENKETHRAVWLDTNDARKYIPPAIETKEYEIWCEGYSATGEHGTAHLMGKATARNFPEACHIVMCQLYLEQVKKDLLPGAEYSQPGRWDYDPTRLTYWACRLFPKESEAKVSFG